MELDIVETEENMRIVSIYTHTQIMSKSGVKKIFNQRSNIRHKNSVVKWLYLAVYSIPQFLGLANDDLQIVKVPLFDNVDNSIFVIDSATVTLKPEDLRFYQAEITIWAQLEGKICFQQ